MPIKCSCPECGHALTFAEDLSGRPGECSRCRARLRIPVVRQAPAPRAVLDAPVRTGFRIGVGIILAVLFVFVGIPVIFLVIWNIGVAHLERTDDSHPRPIAPAVTMPASATALSPEPELPKTAPPQEERREKPGPVALLKQLLAKVEANGTQERVTTFTQPGRWYKRRYALTQMSYDVQTTNSLVSPLLAKVSWHPVAHRTGEYSSKAEAESAMLQPVADAPSSVRYETTLAFQDGRWVVKDVGWRSELLGMERRFASNRNPQDPVVDFWLAFGGAVPRGFLDQLPEADSPPRAAQGDRLEQAAAEAARDAERKKLFRQQQDADRRIRQADAEVKKETAAAIKLKLIKQLIADGKVESARFRLQKFDDDYKDTRAAAEAKKLLDSLK